jgi:UDP-arabinose 4-epimerase
MTKILVTGGAGYIGSHACKALAAAGFTPVVFDDLSTGNPWAVRWGPLEQGDIRDRGRLREVLEAHGPQAVMHFAALALVGESVREPARYYAVNVGGTADLLDACHAFGVGTFVFSSTCAIYGDPGGLPITEDLPKNPINPYGDSKLMAEAMLRACSAAYGLRHAALRYFNAAGADPESEIGERRDVETHLIPLALDAIAGRRPPLSLMGDDYPTRDGTAVRDYIHVTDLANAHVKALRHLLDGGENLALNLGTGRGYSVGEVLAMAKTVTGSPVPHWIAPRRPGDPSELVADPTASRRLLGADLTPHSSLEEILRTAWAWQSSDHYAEAFRA